MRIGILGGTFDPVHLGHLLLAEGAREALKLEKVLWVPAQAPPHKKPGACVSARDRAAMVERAIEDHPDFMLSRVELDRPAPSYSIDTVRQLQAAEPEAEWFFLIGSDTAAVLPTWKEIQELMGRVRFAVIPRPGAAAGGLPEGVQAVGVETVNISASDIRDRIGQGRSIRYWVPEKVCRMIEQKGFYR